MQVPNQGLVSGTPLGPPSLPEIISRHRFRCKAWAQPGVVQNQIKANKQKIKQTHPYALKLIKMETLGTKRS